MTFEACFDLFESLFGDGYALIIDLVHEVNNRLEPLPSHCACPLQRTFHRIKQCSVPVHFQNAPASLDRVVLAVIGRIVGQNDIQISRSGKLDHSLHELCSSARNRLITSSRIWGLQDDETDSAGCAGEPAVRWRSPKLAMDAEKWRKQRSMEASRDWVLNDRKVERRTWGGLPFEVTGGRIQSPHSTAEGGNLKLRQR